MISCEILGKYWRSLWWEDGNNESDIIIIIIILKEETKATDYFDLSYFSFHFSLVMLFEVVCCYIFNSRGSH